MSSQISCTVTADGVPIPDGSSGGLEDPTILTGLKVDWGRETTVDQPAATSCTFQVLDYESGRVFTDMLRIGTKIVVSAGYSSTDPETFAGTNAWPDGGFETSLWDHPLRHIWGNTPEPPYAMETTTADQTSGTRSLLVTIDRTTGVRLLVSPLEFIFGSASTPQTTAAWELIPRAHAGEKWEITARIKTLYGYTYWLGGCVFHDPYRSSGNISGGLSTKVTGNNQWQDVSLTYSVSKSLTAPGWVGFDISSDSDGNPGDLVKMWIDDVRIRPAAGSTLELDAAVFSGRVVALKQSWDDSAGGPVIDVTAMDLTADLENTVVGDDPWPVQTVADRFGSIMALTNMTNEDSYVIAPSLAGIDLSYRDVDAQGAMGLLSEIASSVDGVLWLAISTELAQDYLYLEDPAERVSHLVLSDATGVVTVITDENASGSVFELSACDVLRDGVEWVQDVQDVTTRVSVTWREQGTDEDGKVALTDRTYTLVNTTAEADYGQRGLSLSSQLQAEADATRVAEQIMARTGDTSWRAGGLVIDDAYNAPAPARAYDYARLLMALLSANNRGGLALTLTDMPGWAIGSESLGVYLEGGSYTYDAGAWVLSLTASNSSGLGGSAAWDDLDPAWAWDQWDPALSWDDLRGAAGPVL